MKAGTQNHLKVKRLRRLLGVPLYRAVGILETLWLLCADCCDEGNIGKFSDEEIADYLEWEGSASDLVRALSDSGWIDTDTDQRLVVHDWLEHCPEYIRARVRKRRARHTKKELSGPDSSKQRTYDQSTADKTGQTRTTAVTAGACPVYSQPNPTQPNQFNSNQSICSELASRSSEPNATADESQSRPKDGPVRKHREAASGPAKCDQSEPVLNFPVVGKGPTEWPLTAAKLAEYREAFPDLDVLAQCRAARQWCLDNRAKRKTFGGMAKFLSGWLTRAQERGAGGRSGAAAQAPVRAGVNLDEIWSDDP